MIQRTSTISFGQTSVKDIKAKVQQAQDKKEAIIDGTVGAGGAVALTNGSKAVKAIKGVTTGNKTVKAVKGVAKESITKTSKFKMYTMRFQKSFKTILEAGKTVKGLGWAAKAAEKIAFGRVGRVLGGFAAIGVCAKDFQNMVTASAKIFDGKFPVLESFGLNNK